MRALFFKDSNERFNMKTLLSFAVFVLSLPTFAALQKQSVDYKSADGAGLEGYVAYEDSGVAQKPAVLIVPDWMGMGPHPKAKAEEVAKMGYVAFAVDVYGKGQAPKDQKQASELATKYKSDRALLRSRVQAAYDQVKAMKNVDPKKIVVMGYCFGGTTALELGRSGAALAGIASFHGGLNTPTPADAKNIKAPVLVMHGADDPFVPAEEVAAFKKEMKDAGVKMTFISYKKAVHSFTIREAGNDNSKGAAYNADADKKSWIEFTKFLKEVTKS